MEGVKRGSEEFLLKRRAKTGSTGFLLREEGVKEADPGVGNRGLAYSRRWRVRRA